MYEKITGEDLYTRPMRIYPAVHYTMGGLWVDYELGTTVPGLYATGEANFSDHGANRLGASALMQGLADGYFVLPYTIGSFLSTQIRVDRVKTDDPAFVQAEKEVSDRLNKLLSIKGKQTVDDFHKRLGKIMWDECGMARSAEGLKKAAVEVKKIREEFWQDVRVPGSSSEFNPELDKAGRVADFLELSQLMIQDALAREESCGGHFRLEYVSEDGEAQRNDEDFTYVAAWEYQGPDTSAILHKEDLVFENVELKTRSYK